MSTQQHSPNYAAALAFCETLTSQDGPANVALRTPTCRQTIIPSSLGYPPHMSNDAWLANFAFMTSVLSKMHIQPIELMEADRQVTIWAKGDLELRPHLRGSNGEEWRWSGDTVWALQFDKAGKITDILEMLDSANANSARPAWVEAAKRLHES